MEAWDILPDVRLTFICDGTEFKADAHRGILASSCAFFHRYFTQYNLMRDHTTTTPDPVHEPDSHCHAYTPIVLGSHATEDCVRLVWHFVYHKRLPARVSWGEPIPASVFISLGRLAAFFICEDLMQALFAMGRQPDPPDTVVEGMLYLWKQYPEFEPFFVALAAVTRSYLPFDFFDRHCTLEKKLIEPMPTDPHSLSKMTIQDIYTYFRDRPCIPSRHRMDRLHPRTRGYAAPSAADDRVDAQLQAMFRFHCLFALGAKAADVREHFQTVFAGGLSGFTRYVFNEYGRNITRIIAHDIDRIKGKLPNVDMGVTSPDCTGPFVHRCVALHERDCDFPTSYAWKGAPNLNFGDSYVFDLHFTPFHNQDGILDRVRIVLEIQSDMTAAPFLSEDRETMERAFQLFLHPFEPRIALHPIHIPCPFVAHTTHYVARRANYTRRYLLLEYEAKLPPKPDSWSKEDWDGCFGRGLQLCIVMEAAHYYYADPFSRKRGRDWDVDEEEAATEEGSDVATPDASMPVWEPTLDYP